MEAAVDSSPPIILVVEDDPRIAMFITKGLRASGFAPEWVTTAADALGRISSGAFAAMVLDLGLPDMDGLTLLRELTMRSRSVPTVVVTARTDPRDRQAALDLGVRAYITKPFPFAALVTAVREAAGVQRGTPGSD